MYNEKEIILDKIATKIGFELVTEITGRKNGEKRKSMDEIEKEEKKEPTDDTLKEIERIINKALGILVEDGLFAYSVWLSTEEKYGDKITKKTIELLNETKIIENNEKMDLTHIVSSNISRNLEKLMLAIQIIERMLIYARYRAKAKGAMSKFRST